MAGALTFLLIGCLLQGVQCEPWKVNMLQTIEVLRGSCVTIPCSFDIDRTHNNNLDQTCKAVWKKRSNDEVVFDSKTRTNGELIGKLTDRDCTTTLNNMVSDDTYYFKLECENALKWDFSHDLINIVTKADPPSPTLTPSTLEVEEGTSVRVTCSAPAPCLSHPPTLTWSPRLGDSQETLQENQDKTKVQTSVLTFTASHLHHGQKISCTALYRKQDGSNQSSSSKTSAFTVSYPPKDTTVSVSPSGPVPENRNVTLTCSSTANPAVRSYTWYRTDGDQETFIGTGHILKIEVSKVSSPFFCKTENDLGVGRSTNTQIDVQFPPQILASSHCTKTESQINCSCETVGNPSPTLHWYLDGRPVNQSGEVLISSGSLNGTGLRSFIIVNKLKERSLSTLFCHSFNSLGSARQQFNVTEDQSSTERQGLGHYCGVLPWALAGGFFSSSVFFIICIIFLCKSQRNVEPNEEDRTYMSLDRRNATESSEYDVITRRPK